MTDRELRIMCDVRHTGAFLDLVLDWVLDRVLDCNSSNVIGGLLARRVTTTGIVPQLRRWSRLGCFRVFTFVTPQLHDTNAAIQSARLSLEET